MGVIAVVFIFSIELDELINEKCNKANRNEGGNKNNQIFEQQHKNK
jgi:hypothetical protein